jgi:putative addiction module killer protein
MIQIEETEYFAKWLHALSDNRAKARIASQIDRLAAGNPGDVKPVGAGISEMRIDNVPDIACTS